MDVWSSLMAYSFGSILVILVVVIVLLLLHSFVILPFWANLLIAFTIGWLINYFVLMKYRIQQRIYDYLIYWRRNLDLYFQVKQEEREAKLKEKNQKEVEDIAWKKGIKK
jgi:hypothetical protein